MIVLHPDDREAIVSAWESSVASSAGYLTPVHRFIRSSGEIVFVEVRAVPLTGTFGDRNFLGVLEDVTGRIAAERERQELLARAEGARTEAEAARREAEGARAERNAVRIAIHERHPARVCGYRDGVTCEERACAFRCAWPVQRCAAGEVAA